MKFQSKSGLLWTLKFLSFNLYHICKLSILYSFSHKTFCKSLLKKFSFPLSYPEVDFSVDKGYNGEVDFFSFENIIVEINVKYNFPSSEIE